MKDVNQQWILAKRPIGFPEIDTWEVKNSEIPKPSSGEMLLKHLYVSIDPAMRGWMNKGKSYIEPIEIGAVMRAGVIAEVMEVGDGAPFQKGDILTGWNGVQQYSITNGKGWQKIPSSQLPLPYYLGALGMTGLTAYFGLLEVGKAKEGDVVLVSAAAGAVGSVVCQIAKIKGCKVIGIAGGKAKCDYLINELNIDKALDYKAENFLRELRVSCADGIDVYFDNVGGEILDAALTLLKRHARIVICGAISQYNNDKKIKGPNNYMSLLVNRATMQGMVVFDYKEKYPSALSEMGKWVKEGKLKSEFTIIEGIENFYKAFKTLFSGEKQGKLVLKVN
ncbi:NADP-dependent oxidoreductase [Aegicerativicinus sediminis]|uniref:NADP-dependent oxidoreductase n=1 Tax=Aegicerativicinus sediminis TaxID=2893202 RepID=UPI001E63B35A|nr:NADP-dependent oxidoreductase [Aegicerativicinus sediminis]